MASSSAWLQRAFSIPARARGSHLITDEVVRALPELRTFEVGLLHLFIQHTSAALSINENADPDVRKDMETALNRVVPEGAHYVHSDEGPDDMPAHVKSTLVGASVSVPVTGGRLNLGTWQGIYLCEFRNHGGPRKLVATLSGIMAARVVVDAGGKAGGAEGPEAAGAGGAGGAGGGGGGGGRR